MNWIDIEYLNQISSSLRNFKKKSQNLWNFSCPLCGDSKKNPRKARGFVFQKKGSYFYKCHNCDAGHTFSNFLKKTNPVLHRDYVTKCFQQKRNKYAPIEKPSPQVKQKINQNFELKDLKSFPENHVSRKYAEKRKIPFQKLNNIFYTKDFYKWINSIKPNFFELKKKTYEAIVFPLHNIEGEISGYQGRLLDDKYSRYVTVRILKDCDMIFGLGNVDFKKKIYVVEGGFDSLFLPNAIALRSATVSIPQKIIRECDFTVVFDNEARSKEITNVILKSIKKGYKVSIWDRFLKKDINEEILSGTDKDELKKYIDHNTFQGARAILEFNEWKKC